jgi:hypothetical protein
MTKAMNASTNMIFVLRFTFDQGADYFCSGGAGLLPSIAEP